MCAALSALLLLAIGARAAVGQEADDETRTTINKQVTNPVSTTWSLKWQNEILSLDRHDGSNRAQYEMQFQPSLPVLLTPAWKLIVRPEFTLIDNKPFTDADGRSSRSTGVGDTILDLALSPVLGPWLLGVGPTFIFPTANREQTGQGTWQVGPGGVFGYQAKRWLLGLIAQQWFSYAGSSSRKADSELHLQYLASWFLPHGWSIGTSPIIEFDWRASPGQQVSFPLGLYLAKVERFGALPVKFQVEGLYSPVRPDSYGQEFGLKLYITPVVPSLVDGPLFGE